jgi:hypothetical protein
MRQQHKIFSLNCQRKTLQERIFQLEQDEGTFVNEANLRVFILEYHK